MKKTKICILEKSNPTEHVEMSDIIPDIFGLAN